jgi:hypothetical protein
MKYFYLLKDDIVAYGLVKKVERIDESNTLRFCFVYWLGERVPRMQRARISTHRGTVLDFFAVSSVFSSSSSQENKLDEKRSHENVVVVVLVVIKNSLNSHTIAFSCGFESNST